jgi:LacI family transcriptional regulator
MAGVSSATVSRVINQPDSVKPETRDKVTQAMLDLNYRYNGIAASLSSKKSNTIGYVVPELHGFFFGGMISGTEQVLRKANKHMLVAAGHSNERDEVDAIEYLRSRRCDALILHVEAVSDAYLNKLAQQDIPFVVVNRYIASIGEQCIALDNEKGGYLATRCLIEAGHKHIAYIAGSLWKADGFARLSGHKRALKEAGLIFNPRLMYEGTFQPQSGLEAIRALLATGIPFTALACGNDEMASGAIDGMRQQGIDVPSDVSVVGFDNVEFCNYISPRLTTVNYPTQTIGESAARWVLSQVYNQALVPFEHIISPNIVKRESVSRHSN